MKLALIAALVVLAGCSASADRNRARIDTEIRNWRDYPPFAGTAIGDRIQGNILSTLEESDDASLRHPRLAAAFVFVDTSDTLQLTVYWIEDSPTLSEVTISSEHGHIRRSIREDDRKILQRGAIEDGDLVFYSIWDFPNLSDVQTLKLGKHELTIAGVTLSGDTATSIAIDWYVVE